MDEPQRFKFLTDTEFDGMSLSERAQYLVAAQQHVQMIQRKLSIQLQSVVKAQQEQAFMSVRASQRQGPTKH